MESAGDAEGVVSEAVNDDDAGVNDDDAGGECAGSIDQGSAAPGVAGAAEEVVVLAAERRSSFANADAGDEAAASALSTWAPVARG